MSFSFTIAGHSPNPHNDAVTKIAVDAVRALKALEGSVSITGYTYDSSGDNRTLNDELVWQFEQLDAKAAEAPTSAEINAAGAPPAETTSQPVGTAPPEVVAEVAAAAPTDSTETPVTTPTDGA